MVTVRHLLIIALCGFSLIASDRSSIEATVSTSPLKVECQGDTCLDTFEVAGRLHAVVYPKSMSDEALAAHNALVEGITYYQQLWQGRVSKTGQAAVPGKIDFNVNVLMIPSELKTETFTTWGAASPEDIVFQQSVDNNATIVTTEEICQVEIYYVDNPGVWQAIVLHELAHCYQFFYVPNFQYTVGADEWWVEGSAEWMISTVDSIFTPAIYTAAGRDVNFTYALAKSTFLRDYDNVYFWLFVEGQYGRTKLLDLLVNMPQIHSFEEYGDYLRTALPGGAEGAMQQFALALYDNKVPHQFPSTQLQYGTRMLKGLPSAEAIYLEPFAISYLTFAGIQVDEGQKLRIEAKGTAAIEMRLSPLTGSDQDYFKDGEPVEICNPAETLTVALSRAGHTGDSGVGYLEFTSVPAAEGECDAEPEEVTMPACLVNLWHIAKLPDPPDVGPGAIMYFQFDPEAFYFMIWEDGRFQSDAAYIKTITYIEGGTEISGELMFHIHGQMAVVQDDVALDQYHVVKWDVTIDILELIANIDGLELDITDMFLQMMGGGSTFMAPRYFTCFDDQTLAFTVGEPGSELTYLMKRPD